MSILSHAKFTSMCEKNLVIFIYSYSGEGISFSFFESAKVRHDTAECKDRLSSALMSSFPELLCDA